jgi:hypothetical protein
MGFWDSKKTKEGAIGLQHQWPPDEFAFQMANWWLLVRP